MGSEENRYNWSWYDHNEDDNNQSLKINNYNINKIKVAPKIDFKEIIHEKELSI